MSASAWLGMLTLVGFLQDPEAGRRLLQENRLEEAQAVFEKVLEKSPSNVDALVGAGFTALRRGRLSEAKSHFQAALTRSPQYSDAAYGLALVHWRMGQIESARRFAKETLRLDPKHAEVKALLLRMPEEILPVPPAPTRPVELQLPFRTSETAFQVQDGAGWRTIYLKGVNLGAALPGHFPTEFPSKEVYKGWLNDMGDLGINVLRVYTIHPPAFYEAVREHNLKAPQPIYLLHGLWVDPPPGDDFEDPGWFGTWKEDMQRMVDVLHGRAGFAPRTGLTGGNYRADVSPWWIGTILGREWEPFNVFAFNKLHPGLADWKGRFLEIRQGHATEIFMAKAMDAFIAIEHDRYHMQRPVAFSNWPTLDPLTHPTETPYMEEQLLRQKLGMPYSLEPREGVYDDDSVAVDLEKYTALKTFQGGIFASYHIYPNYPEFINLDPGYNRAKDEQGPNSFFGYLLDLRRWHKKHPVVVSEYGISNSRNPAHWQPQGMTHGGLDEKAQAQMLQRLTRNIHDAGYAGSVVFAWMDEWWKKTWQTEPIELPQDRDPFWFNAMDAEENYGIIGHHPGSHGPNILIDGRLDDWKAVPAYQKGQDLELKLFADEGWLHVGLFWNGPKPDWETERFVMGLDTVDATLGSHRLPFGVPLRSEAGLEFALELSGNGCEVYVDAPYDYSPHRRKRPIRSVAHEDGVWRQMQTETNRLRIGRDGTVYPSRRYEVGTLRKGTQDRTDPAFDSLAEWNEGPGFLEVRIPWFLLQVTDPGSLRVLQDAPDPVKESAFGTVVTEGLRACLVRLRQLESGRYQAVESLPSSLQGQLPLPPLFRWEPWQQPRWHAYRKLAFQALADTFSGLPPTPGKIPASTPQIAQPPPPAPRQAFNAPGRVQNELLEQARKAREQKDWAGALKAYDALLEKDPSREAAWFERAQTLGWAGDYVRAAEAWRQLRQRVPGRTLEADRNLAEVAGWGRDYELAVRTLEPYVQKGERWAILDSAKYLSWDGSYRSALALTSAWLDVHPRDEDFLFLQAQVLSWDARLADARQAYANVLVLRPDHAEARMGLARIAAWMGRFDEARTEFDKLPEQARGRFEARVLDAQILLGEDQVKTAVGRLKVLASSKETGWEDATDLLRATAIDKGPMAEIGQSRSDSSDGLRNLERYARVRMPLGNGSLGLGYTWYESRLAGREASPHGITLSWAQPIGSWRFSGELGRISGWDGAPASHHRINAMKRLGHGMELSLNQFRSVVTATPEATDRRMALHGFGAGFSWTGYSDVVSLQAGSASLSAGNRQRSWSAAYEHRWRVSPFTIGAGVTLRGLSHSASLPLGYWNPERYDFQGITGKAAFERRRFALSANAQWGRQAVDRESWNPAWAYGVDVSWGLGRSPFTLLGGWSSSSSVSNAVSAAEPSHYREHTFRLGIRITGY